MLHREHQVATRVPQIEIGIAEGVEIGRSAKTLAGLDGCGSRLAGVMHEDDGEVEALAVRRGVLEGVVGSRQTSAPRRPNTR